MVQPRVISVDNNANVDDLSTAQSFHAPLPPNDAPLSPIVKYDRVNQVSEEGGAVVVPPPLP